MNSQHNKFLNRFKQSSDKNNEAQNFRLFYQDIPTNLIWYDEMLIFIPKEFFELKNLVNIDTSKEYVCSLTSNEITLLNILIENIKDLNIEECLNTLINRINISGILSFNQNLTIELLTQKDYSNITKPIYLGNSSWFNIK